MLPSSVNNFSQKINYTRGIIGRFEETNLEEKARTHSKARSSLLIFRFHIPEGIYTELHKFSIQQNKKIFLSSQM